MGFDVVSKDSAFDPALNKLTVPLGLKKLVRLFPTAPVTSDDIFVNSSNESVVKVTRVTGWSMLAPDSLVPPLTMKTMNQSFMVDYYVEGLAAGSATVEARTFDSAPASMRDMKRAWGSGRLYASLTVNVLGVEYAQADSRWGNLVYGSANPAYKGVAFTTMGWAGCGPTALSDIMDFLTKRDDPKASVNPIDAMNYASKYGRAVNANNEPDGTDGDTMVANLGTQWPGYKGERVLSVEMAIALLQRGQILLFRCLNGVTYKHNSKTGAREDTKWPGHFMVLWGVETGGKTFWISDPSTAKTKFIDYDELKNHCTIWNIYKDSDVARAAAKD